MLAAHSIVAGLHSLETVRSESVSLWNQVLQPVESFLPKVAEKIEDQASLFEEELVLYAQYALATRGKQLRPILVALAGGATGSLGSNHVSIAVIIEMIHLATLAHDDVMDGARIRRNRPTLAANWGDGISVLIGDCLFSHALEMASEFPNPGICRAFARAAKRVCSGEILQTQKRQDLSLTRAGYFRVIEMKTAELFALACEMGAEFSGAPHSVKMALRRYGTTLGTAYQIYDDCLDLFGTEEAAGKSLGTDLAKGKLTLPFLVALERSSVVDRASLAHLLENWDPACLDRLQQTLFELDCFEESHACARRFLDESRTHLRDLEPSAYAESLAHLLNYVDLQFQSLGSE